MLSIIILIAACVGMYRIAEADGKSGAMWAGITFLLGFGLSFVLGFFGPPLGFVLAFGAMFAVNLMSD